MIRLPLILLLASAVCFAIATVIAATSQTGNFDGWLAGGLLALVLSMLVAPFTSPAGPQ